MRTTEKSSSDNDKDIASVKTEIVHLRNDVNKINRILVEGEPHSLITRVSISENELEKIQIDIEKIKTENRDKESDSEDKTFSTRLMIYSSVIGLLAALLLKGLDLLIQLGGKK